MSAPNPALDALIKSACQVAGLTIYHADYTPPTALGAPATLRINLPGALNTARDMVEAYLQQWIPVGTRLIVTAVGYGWFPFPIAPTPPDSLPVPEVPEKEPDTDRLPQPTTDERLASDRRDGMNCYRCGDWFYMAEPNRMVRNRTNSGDEAKFECYRCSQDQFRPGTRRRAD